MTKEQREAIKSLNEFANTKYGAFTAKEGQTVLSMLQEQQEENKKKDKIIDLMAECIDVELSSARLGTILNKNVKPLETYKEEVKRYFENKAEKEYK